MEIEMRLLTQFVLLVISSGCLSCVAGTLSPPTPQARSLRVKTATDLPSSSSSSSSSTMETSKGKLLSRKRRYVAFPEGSSASAALCLTIGVLGNPNVNFLSWAVNWGVAYDLPNYTWAIQHAHGFKNDVKETRPIVQRRSRRDLYEKIEAAIDSMGFDGRACIGRALCESAQYLRPSKSRRGNMFEEIIKTIFSLPSAPVQRHEPRPVHRYDRIYRRARRELHDCSVEYAQCRFSLLELAFGRYRMPSTKHGPMLPMPPSHLRTFM